MVLGSSGFFSSIWGVLESDCVLTGPAVLIKQAQMFFPITTFEVPILIPPYKIIQVWHSRNNDDLEHRWLREKIHNVFKQNYPTLS